MAQGQGLGRWSKAVLAMLLVTTPAVTLFAQSPELATDLPTKAMALEKAQRWLEAAELYRDLARRQPGVPEWSARSRICIRQDQITRRYLDRAVQQRITQIPLEKVARHYGEVLGGIQNHYVDEISLDRILSAGLESLVLALENAAFLKASVAVEVPEAALVRARLQLRERRAEFTARNRHDAEQRVQVLAAHLQQELGMMPTAVLWEFIHAACEGLDEYSAYLTPERFTLEKSLNAGEQVGIGAELGLRHGQIVVLAVSPDGPAAQAGVNANDRVVRIDDAAAEQLGIEEAALRLLGRDGTRITLVLQGAVDNAPRRVAITRRPVDVPSVTNGRIVDPEHGIGYVHVGLFQKSTAAELHLAIARLNASGMRALILDLRGNPGGLLDAGVQVADRFIHDGVIVSTRGRGPGTSSTFRAQDDADWSFPLVVLIDGETASAAEIVAGAIKDHDRGVLVGERTFGKGTVQFVYALRTLPAGIRLTAARYYTPLDGSFGGEGIVPHVLVDHPDMTEAMESMMSMMHLQQLQFDVAVRTARNLLNKP